MGKRARETGDPFNLILQASSWRLLPPSFRTFCLSHDIVSQGIAVTPGVCEQILHDIAGHFCPRLHGAHGMLKCVPKGIDVNAHSNLTASCRLTIICVWLAGSPPRTKLREALLRDRIT